MNIQDIRKQYPQYSDLSDQVLADGFHKKFYSDIPKTDFYSKIGLNPEPSRIGKIGKVISNAVTSGDFTPAEAGSGEASKPFLQAAGSLATGATSWIPAGLSMITPVTISGEGVKLRKPSEMAQTAQDIQESLTYQPKDKSAQNLVYNLTRPISYAAEKGNESRDVWYDMADKSDNRLTKEVFRALGFVSGFGGEAAPFLIPGTTKGAKAIGREAKGAWYKMTVKERGVARQIAKDIESGDMNVNEIREAWKDPANRETLINKYVRAREEGTVKPRSAPEAPIAEPLALTRHTPGGRRGSKQLKIGPARPEEQIYRQPAPVVDVPIFEPPEEITMPDNTAPVEKVEPTANAEGEKIESAVVKVDGQVFTGTTHGEALNKAFESGTLTQEEFSKFNTPKSSKYDTGKEIQIDLFKTNKGRLLDRSEATKEFSVTEALNIPEGRTLRNKAQEGKGTKQGLAAEMKGADETLQLMKYAKDAGKIKTGSLISALGKDSVDKLKKMGLVSDNGAVEYDVFAQEKGLDANDMMQSFLDYKNTSITKKAEADYINEKIIVPQKAAEKLIKKGYEPANSVEAYNLSEGDKIVKGGEEFKVTGEELGHLILKDGETLKVPLESTLDIEGVKKKGGNIQSTIPGTSEAENFSLDNPETDWSKSKPLSEQATPKNETLFSGLDITQTLDVLKGLKSNIQEALPHLENIGRQIYQAGRKTFAEWQAEFKIVLGDMLNYFKSALNHIWKAINNEKGAVGKDINDPVIKQREIKDKDGTTRKAPEIRQSEYETIRGMPELRQKPLGGWTENPIRTFEELGPKIKEIFYRPMKEAESAAKRQFQKIHEQSEKLRKSLPSKSSERIGTFAISKQAGGEEILAKMGVKEIPTLSPREMRVYEWMRKGLETYYEKLQEARAAAGKEKFGHVEDYFTFARQLTLIEELGFSPIFSRERLLNNFIHRKTTPFRFEKHRVGGISRADLDAFGVFNRYMESATRHVNLSPAIAKGREMLLTFKDEKGENWILRDEKPSAAKFITEWLDFQSGQRKPQLPNLIEKGLTKLNKNLAFSILSANIRSALIQPTAIVNTAAEIGPKWTMAGLKSILDNTGMEKSNVLFSRQFDVNVSESLSGLPGKIGRAKQIIGNLGMQPLQFLDMQTAKVTWNGAYKKAISEGMSEKKAINYADDTVTKTQGSAMPSDIAPIQRTALGKAISMFQTFVINQWGFLTRDVLGVKNTSINNKTMFKKVATFVIGTTLFNILYEDVLGVPSPMPTPVSAFMKSLEKDDDMPSASLDAALEIAQFVPVVGGGLRYGSSMLGAPAEYISDIGKKISPNYTGFTRPTGELVGKGLGIPGTAQIGKIVRINNKGGSIIDMALGRYPEGDKRKKLKRAKLQKRETIKGI